MSGAFSCAENKWSAVEVAGTNIKEVVRLPKNIDWIKIKNEYINTNISQRKLAVKYEISFNTLKDKANKEKWAAAKKEQHNKIATETQQKTAEKIIEVEVDRVANIINLSDKISEKISQAIEQVDKIIVDGEIVDAGLIDTYKLRQLVQSLKDVKDIVSFNNDTESSEDKQSALISAIKKAVASDET